MFTKHFHNHIKSCFGFTKFDGILRVHSEFRGVVLIKTFVVIYYGLFVKISYYIPFLIKKKTKIFHRPTRDMKDSRMYVT